MQYREMLDGEVKKHTDVFNSEKAKIQEEIKLLLQTNKNDYAALQASNKAKATDLETKIKSLQAELSVSEFALTKMKEQFEFAKGNSEAVLKVSIDEIVKQKLLPNALYFQ
jgi:uncharacterized protein involved in exopolysaccharide biosynthesis